MEDDAPVEEVDVEAPKVDVDAGALKSLQTLEHRSDLQVTLGYHESKDKEEYELHIQTNQPAHWSSS